MNLKEENDTIYFLHTVTKGRSDKSYGIQVAKLVKISPRLSIPPLLYWIHSEKKALPVSLGKAAPQKTKQQPESQLDFFSAVQPQSEQSKKLQNSWTQSIQTPSPPSRHLFWWKK